MYALSLLSCSTPCFVAVDEAINLKAVTTVDGGVTYSSEINSSKPPVRVVGTPRAKAIDCDVFRLEHDGQRSGQSSNVIEKTDF